MPKRIQRSRAKGWVKPKGSVYVGRPYRWGNPFTAAGYRDAGGKGSDREIAEQCVKAFEGWLGTYWRNHWDSAESQKARDSILNTLSYLRGKDLICWCRLDAPCHADVLLQLANFECVAA